MEIKKNDEIPLWITDLTAQGEGIGRFGGMPFFVRGAIPGDRVLAGVTKLRKTYGYARLVRVEEPSADRVDSPCAVSDRCGGCQLMAMSYEAQLAVKEKRVREALCRIGGFPEEVLAASAEPILGMDNPLRYRNKAQYPVRRLADGTLAAGFFAPRSHRLVPCEDCLLQQQENAEAVRTVLDWMETCEVAPYDEESHSGVVRHILIRHAAATGERMICLVANAERLPAEEALCAKLMALSGVVSVVLNTNRQRTNVILGKQTRTLAGKATITDRLCGNEFAVSAPSFYQINPVQTKKLYETALSYAGLSGREAVWDLYCGIGTITLAAARRAARAAGVEIVPEAIADAKENARRNGIDNISFFCGPAETLLPELTESGQMPAPDVVFLDPPRKGCDEAVRGAVCAAVPERIVYISCDPSTLARDLSFFCGNGYRLEKYRPVDQFGFTMHVEAVVLLCRADC